MPLRKDESGRGWVELEVLVPGTPEQVWQAIATGPGMSAWFTTTSVEERVGGAISFDFGDESCGEDVSSGKVTAWEPPTPPRLRPRINPNGQPGCVAYSKRRVSRLSMIRCADC